MNISNKLKGKNACQPLDVYSYLRASDYFYFNSSRNDSLRSILFQKDLTEMLTQQTISLKQVLFYKKNRIIMSHMNEDEQASYNLAKLLCAVSKKKLISDSDSITKEFNISAITNYVNFKF